MALMFLSEIKPIRSEVNARVFFAVVTEREERFSFMQSPNVTETV